ncbi:hypothetical protein DPX16_0115 [Anabarilius grahami]|uniref:Uncharacterized protein n=1 Tax=Anabarilius grahami TaxID=495550 RepID=A0A3N0XFC2_ANAGA|nr:hypothetical protein DPX16_0115 [Anabarilius grahami]
MSLSTVSFHSFRARTYTLRNFMLSLYGKELLTILLLDYRQIAYQDDHGTWNEKTGYDFLYTLSMVCGIGFQFQELRSPSFSYTERSENLPQSFMSAQQPSSPDTLNLNTITNFKPFVKRMHSCCSHTKLFVLT